MAPGTDFLVTGFCVSSPTCGILLIEPKLRVSSTKLFENPHFPFFLLKVCVFANGKAFGVLGHYFFHIFCNMFNSAIGFLILGHVCLSSQAWNGTGLGWKTLWSVQTYSLTAAAEILCIVYTRLQVWWERKGGFCGCQSGRNFWDAWTRIAVLTTNAMT